MRQEVVHVSNGNAHRWGAELIARAIAFNTTAGLKFSKEHLFSELMVQMTAAQPHTLIQAIISDQGKMVGHCITHLHELYGYRTAMIYQLHIDDDQRDDTRQDMFNDGWNQIVQWAENSGCGAIRAWAMNGKLAEVFKKYGLEPKEYQLVETEIG